MNACVTSPLHVALFHKLCVSLMCFVRTKDLESRPALMAEWSRVLLKKIIDKIYI